MKVLRTPRKILFIFIIGILFLACASINFKKYLLRYLNKEVGHRNGLIKKTAKDKAVMHESVRKHVFQPGKERLKNINGRQENLGTKSVREESLKAYVVEEHHEVLPYWYQAVTRGTIPKEGNLLIATFYFELDQSKFTVSISSYVTLPLNRPDVKMKTNVQRSKSLAELKMFAISLQEIKVDLTLNLEVHIDGHSDLAPLLYVPGYPFFKTPTKKQLRYLMQTNDGFIQASAMTGLFERMIWVWPTWDKNNQLNSHERSYMMYKLYLGWFDVRNKTRASTDLAFCTCINVSNEFSCLTLTETDSGILQSELYYLNRNRCQIMKTLIVEEVSERLAMTYFKKYHWNSNIHGIILDIDEDFYGCSYAINPVLKANFSIEQVQGIDEIIHQVFCPENSEQGAESDRFLVGILNEIAKGDNCKDGVSKMSKKCIKSVKEKYINKITNKLILLMENNVVKLCQPDFNVREVIKMLMSPVVSMTSEQIMSIVEVGFCANTSPKTYDIYMERTFGICIGSNTPNHTAILEHIPTQKEVDSRSIILKGILKRIRHPVGLVTMARSVRDGYTPRKYFEQIEKDILASLRDIFDKNLDVVYDKDLLGGKQGWGKRTADT